MEFLILVVLSFIFRDQRTSKFCKILPGNLFLNFSANTKFCVIRTDMKLVCENQLHTIVKTAQRKLRKFIVKTLSFFCNTLLIFNAKINWNVSKLDPCYFLESDFFIPGLCLEKKVLSTYLPVLVITISVPNLWNSVHKSKFSKSTTGSSASPLSFGSFCTEAWTAAFSCCWVCWLCWLNKAAWAANCCYAKTKERIHFRKLVWNNFGKSDCNSWFF